MAQPPPEFDELTYLDLNPDVLRAVLEGNFASGYDHWVQRGQAEGRALWPAEAKGTPPGWNEARYLRLNPDVAGAVRANGFASGYEHWALYGSYEGRPGGMAANHKSAPRAALLNGSHGINLYAFHGAQIGLGAAAQGYAAALGGMLPLHQVTIPWEPESLAAMEMDSPPHAINVFHMNPDILPLFFGCYGAGLLPGRYNVGIWVWEMHAGYAAWHAQSRLFDEIWTPSEYSARAIRLVSAAPVHVVPHVVDRLPSPAVPEKPAGSPFVFLYMFDVASSFERKNPLGLIRAFRKAFGDRRDVELILKFHHPEFGRPEVDLLERVAKSSPNIRTINQTLPENELYALLRSCDCFVSPHRSEGFGLNIASAMYFGKPVIATGYSGNTDFTTAENSFPIDYDVVPLQQDAGAYKAHYAWAEPSEDHLAGLLRTVVERPEEARRRASRGRRTIQDRYSVRAVSEVMRRRFKEWGFEEPVAAAGA